MRSLGLGFDLLDTDVSTARLRPRCWPGRRRYREHSSRRWIVRDGRDGVAAVAPLDGRSAPGGLAARRGYRLGHHPVRDRLLDSLAHHLQAHVLDLHPRHLFLYRPLFRLAQQSRAVPHAQYVHRGVAAGRKYLQSHRGAVGGRGAERLVRRHPRHRCGIAATGIAVPGADRISGRLIICTWRPRPSSPIRSAPSATRAAGLHREGA